MIGRGSALRVHQNGAVGGGSVTRAVVRLQDGEFGNGIHRRRYVEVDVVSGVHVVDAIDGVGRIVYAGSAYRQSRRRIQAAATVLVIPISVIYAWVQGGQ